MIREKGIVLRTIKYSEADLIVKVLTKRGDKLDLFAKSALRSRKRFGGGVLQPTHFIHFNYQSSRSLSGLEALKEASLIKDFKFLRKDYEKLILALKILDIIDRVAQVGNREGEGFFNLLGNTLKTLETCKSLLKLYTQFEIKLLFHIGILKPSSETYELLRTSILKNNELDIEESCFFQLKRGTENILQKYLLGLS